MIQLIIGLVMAVVGLVIALFSQLSRNKEQTTLLQNAEVKKNVEVGNQQIKDLQTQTDQEKKDDSKEDLLKFLNSDTPKS